MAISKPYVSLGIWFGGLASHLISKILFALFNDRSSLTQAGGGAVIETRQADGSLALTQLDDNEPGYPGFFRAVTVADGAPLGEERLTSDQQRFDGGWQTLGESTVTGGEGRIHSSTGDLSQVSMSNSVLEIGGKYLVSYDVLSHSGADITNSGGEITWPMTAGDRNSIEIIAPQALLVFKRGGIVDATIDNVSVRPVLPTHLGTLPDGTPVHPKELVGGKATYPAYNAWEATETLAVGDKRTFNNISNWMEVSAITTGITGGTEPTLPAEGGTVVDGGVTWSRDAENYYASGHGGVLVEPAGTNLFLNSTVPVNQTIDLTGRGTGDYKLSVYGSGSVTVAAGSATGTGFGAATDGSDVTFNISVEGTINLTVSGGPPDYVQVELGSTATSPIETGVSEVIRPATNISAPVSSVLPASGNDFWVYVEGEVTWDGTNNFVLVRSVGPNDDFRLYVASGFVTAYDKVDGAAATIATDTPLAANTPTFLRIAFAKNSTTGIRLAVNDDPLESNGTRTGPYDDVTSLSIGSFAGASQFANGTIDLNTIHGEIDSADLEALADGSKTLAEVV